MLFLLELTQHNLKVTGSNESATNHSQDLSANSANHNTTAVALNRLLLFCH